MIKLTIILFVLICILYILQSKIIEHYENPSNNRNDLPLVIAGAIALGLVQQ